MNRRSVLAGLGALATTGVAGCVSRSATLASGDPHPVRLSLADADSTPDDVPVRMAVDLLEPEVTDEHPARLRTTTTNTGSKRSLSFRDSGCELFRKSRSGSDPSGLWLHRAGTTERIDRKGDRWTADENPMEGRTYDGYGCGWEAYEAGESVSTEYVVWDDYRAAGYFDPGTYRWEESVAVTTATGGEQGRRRPVVHVGVLAAGRGTDGVTPTRPGGPCGESADGWR